MSDHGWFPDVSPGLKVTTCEAAGCQATDRKHRAPICVEPAVCDDNFGGRKGGLWDGAIG
ncbi:MAG: hypothetical protein JSS49_30630 [Planctomycetes bacterium]|nr:hypothetical protein [Planctomycetota bacterium]